MDNIDRLDGIWDQLAMLADNLRVALRDNAMNRRHAPKRVVDRHIQRLIGARLLLVHDPRASEENPAWAASSNALVEAKRYGFDWN